MAVNFTIGQYYPGKSPLHCLDPRTKIAGTILFVSSIFLAETAIAYLALLAFTVLAVAVSGIPARTVVWSVKPLRLLIGLTVLIHAFSTPGDIIGGIGPLTATWEGLARGGLMALRLIFLIIMSSLLTFTTSPLTLTDGIEKLLRPFRRVGLPAHELAMMMAIALRFIPTLLEETDRIIKAQTARGADFNQGSLITRAKKFIPLLVPLFISAFRRADELATAMEARCYRGGENRTRMRQLAFSARDGLAALLLAALTALLGVLRWTAI